jgi:cation diffusion facilitator family transporter
MKKNRLHKIKTVLILTFFMNLATCVIKIALGIATGITAIMADGFHSLGDCLSNIVGFFGIQLAQRKPDEKHGYGYEKFEAVVTLLIVSLMAITCYKVFETGINRLLHPSAIVIEPFILAAMIISMCVNVGTIIYEGRAGKKLKSELLIADSNETKGDLWVSSGVIAATFIMSKTHWYWLDGVITILIGFIIVHIIVETVIPTAKQLADVQIVEPKSVIETVMAVPGARFCHAVRSRGHEEAFFLDLHLGVNRKLSIEVAHDIICHEVKLALHKQFPGLKSANVHIEPDNEAGLKRVNSTFRDRDSYDHN